MAYALVVILLGVVGQEARAAAVGEFGRRAVARAQQPTVLFLDGQHARHALVTDVGAGDHLRRGEGNADGIEPAMAGFERETEDGVVHAPHQLVHVLLALVAQHGKAPALPEEQSALGGYAMQAAGMLADDMTGKRTLIDAHAHGVELVQGVILAAQQLDCLARDGLHAVMHAEVRNHAVIHGHVAGGGFDHRAAAERRQDAPGVVAHALAVDDFKQGCDVSA